VQGLSQLQLMSDPERSSERFPTFISFSRIDEARRRTLTLISLVFYCTQRGKIISSLQHEAYTTFQEIRGAPITDRDQLSDLWLVRKLYEHYRLINRRQQSAIWDLLSLRTIGFATFIRVRGQSSYVLRAMTLIDHSLNGLLRRTKIRPAMLSPQRCRPYLQKVQRRRSSDICSNIPCAPPS